MFDWIGDLLREIWDYRPIKTIRSYERGILFTAGHAGVPLGSWLRYKLRSQPLPDPSELTTGIHIYFPGVQELEVFSTAEEVLSTEVDVTMADGSKWTFRPQLTYKIINAVKWFCEVQDFRESLADMIATHITARLQARDPKLLYEPGAIEQLSAELKSEVTKRANKWGATIREVGFKAYTRATPIRLLNDRADL